MPLTSPYSCWRRAMPWNACSASSACFTSTPTWRAAAIAASAFSTLCAPISDHCTVPRGCPPSRSSKREKSCTPCTARALHSASVRGSRAKPSSGVRHATDEKPGVAAGVLEDLRQERGARGLAMGAGDREHPAPFEHLARQPLGPRRKGEAALEQRFDDRLAARHDVADQHHVRRRRE